MDDTKIRIAQVRDPHLFQRLVNKLMLAEHGTDYQVVDDSGGDNGLDGYLRTKGELYACYCPEKPESADFARKLRSDLKKAQTLRDDHGYPIRRFVFVTPMALREPVQRGLREAAKEVGFEDGINVADELLEAILARHPELRDDFPDLNYPRVEAEVREIRQEMQALREALARPSQAATSTPASISEQEETRAVTIGLFRDVDTTSLVPLQEALERGDSDALYRLEQTSL